MDRVKRITASSFGSAVLGGLVVAVCGSAAIASGVIDTGDGGGSARALAPPPVATPASGSADALSVNQIYEQASPGVAFIESRSNGPALPEGPFGAPPGGRAASGSGFVIDEQGHVVTNAHVVAGAQQITVTLSEDSDSLEAKVIGRDPSTDIAVLEVDAPQEQLEPLSLGDSSQVSVGDAVVAIGNPFGLDRTATAGIVSALQREIPSLNGFTITDVIQTDAPINPGNSGGPLLDAAGRVVGVNSQIESPGGGNVGIGFAVPINTARDVARQLIADGEVEHAFLGLTGADLDSRLTDVLNLDSTRGVLVQEVVPDGPADRAGLEAGDAEATIDGRTVRVGGDLIVAIDGEPVAEMADVIAAVDSRKPGDEVELTVVRDGQERTLTTALGDRPASAGN
jgi:S1-C subfamily serine protease